MRGQQLIGVLGVLGFALLLIALTAITVNAISPLRVESTSGTPVQTAAPATGDGTATHPVTLSTNSITWTYLLKHGSCAQGQYIQFDVATGGFTCGTPPSNAFPGLAKRTDSGLAGAGTTASQVGVGAGAGLEVSGETLNATADALNPQITFAFAAVDGDAFPTLDDSDLGFYLSGNQLQANGTSVNTADTLYIADANAVASRDPQDPGTDGSGYMLHASAFNNAASKGGKLLLTIEAWNSADTRMAQVRANTVTAVTGGWRLTNLRWVGDFTLTGAGVSWRVAGTPTGPVLLADALGAFSIDAAITGEYQDRIVGLEKDATTGTYTRKTTATAAGQVQFNTSGSPARVNIYAHSGDVAFLDKAMDVDALFIWQGVTLDPTTNVSKASIAGQTVYTFDYHIEAGSLPAAEQTATAMELHFHTGPLDKAAFSDLSGDLYRIHGTPSSGHCVRWSAISARAEWAQCQVGAKA